MLFCRRMAVAQWPPQHGYSAERERIIGMIDWFMQ
jgi:hypothetical protein